MAQKPIPPADVAIGETTDANGRRVDVRISQAWLEYLQARDKLGGQADVSTVAPTNGQVLVWNAVTRLWVPGAN